MTGRKLAFLKGLLCLAFFHLHSKLGLRVNWPGSTKTHLCRDRYQPWLSRKASGGDRHQLPLQKIHATGTALRQEESNHDDMFICAPFHTFSTAHQPFPFDKVMTNSKM